MAGASSPARSQDRGAFSRFDDWFRRYRDGRIVFNLRGGRAPSGTQVDTFAPESPFNVALGECVRSKSPAGADRLLEVATFHFSDSAGEELERFAAQSPDRVREEALTALARMRNPEVIEYLSREVLLERSKTAPAKRAAAATALGFVKDETLSLALYSASSDSAPEVRAAAVSAVAEYADIRISLLTRWLADPEPDIRLLALGAAQQSLTRAPADVNKTPILDLVRARLADTDWRIRDRAIDVLTIFPQKESVSPLISAVAAELEAIPKKLGRKRVARHAGDALIQITGVEIPPLDAGRWRKWWDNAKERFQTGEHAAGTPRTAADMGSYFTIAIKSDRLVFVIDTSGSMNEPYGAPLTRADASTASKDRKLDGTKLERVKEELIRVIRKLDEGDRFQIIAFSSQAKAAFPALSLATKEQKRHAERFVKSLVGDGGTALWDGLELALHFAGAGEGLPGRDADTIFVLTDGEPTSGKIVEPAEITRGVQKFNRNARVEVNTIFVGPEDGAGSQLLTQLAKDNGGEFRRVTDK